MHKNSPVSLNVLFKYELFALLILYNSIHFITVTVAFKEKAYFLCYIILVAGVKREHFDVVELPSQYKQRKNLHKISLTKLLRHKPWENVLKEMIFCTGLYTNLDLGENIFNKLYYVLLPTRLAPITLG